MWWFLFLQPEDGDPVGAYEKPLEIKATLPELSREARAELAADWAWVALEVERRGCRWSVADVLAEFPRDRGKLRGRPA